MVMQKKDYFHELTDKEKKFYFFTELYSADPKVRFSMAAVLAFIGVVDLILRFCIYPLLDGGKVHPIFKPAFIPWAFCMVSFMLSLITYPKMSEKHLTRLRNYLAYVTALGGGAYHYLVTFEFVRRALDTQNPDDWTFSLLTISNGVHQTVFVTVVCPSWPYVVFSLSCSYAGLFMAYMQSDETLKYWVLAKSLANILYLTLYVLVGTYYRWRNFLKYSEAEAWNRVYNDTLNRIPSAIAVMNVSGDLIYSNEEFKKTSENDSNKLFKSITNLKTREISFFSTTEGFFPKTSHDDFGILTTNRNRYPGASNGSPYFMLKSKDVISPRSAKFNKLEDLLEHYRLLLAGNNLRSEEPVVYDSKMEIKGLYNHHTFSYEVIIRPLIEYKKIVIILNNTTQRDLVASLEDNNDYKDKLLASVSHELRTPLNGNLVLLQAAVQEEDVPTSVKEKLLMPALRSGRLLSHLINDLLDYSTMVSDKITLFCETRPLKESLEYCCQLLEQAFKAKQLKFGLKIHPSVPYQFCTDHQRLIQIILNLLSNALKFTFNGEVTVEVKAVGENPSILEISISDTGIGIPKETLLKLFEEDLMTTARGVVTCKGVGLGLKVANKLVKILEPEDGDGLQVNSIDGKGSVFYFKILQQENGEEEVEEKLLDEFERNNCSLPDIPAEFTEDNKRRISVVKFKRSRFKYADLKPPGSLTSRDNKEPMSSSRTNKVLIVDDDQINILALEILLKQLKISAECAYNGQQGIDKVLANPKKYQMIFMDCQMPVMDGFEATKQLVEKMKSEEIPIIPIVGCTAFSARNKIEECLKSGMVEVIHKPVLKEKLKQILDNYL